MAEAMPWDDFSDHVTTQAVGARFLETEQGANTFELVRSVIGVNDPYTVRQACIAMEEMDLSPLVPQIEQAAADDERHPRHPLPAGARPVRASAPGRWPR